MGNYTSEFLVPEREAVSKHTHPSQPNWITLHAVSTELSIAEVERLWARFRQLKCNSDGEVTEANIAQLRIHSDAFARNIMKRMLATYGREKKITFENYIRALKWVETAETDKKLRAIHRLLNNAQPVPRNMFVKILERIYTNPEDRKDLDRVSQTFFDMMDPDNTGNINEESFARVMFNVPSETLDQVLDFQILPNYMKERLHQNLPEFFAPKETTLTVPGQGDKFSSRGVTPASRPTTQQPVTVKKLKEMAPKIMKKDWQKLANKLGFTTEDVDEIRDQFPGDNQRQVTQLLLNWRERLGDLASPSVLERALKDCQMKEAISVLKAP